MRKASNELQGPPHRRLGEEDYLPRAPAGKDLGTLKDVKMVVIAKDEDEEVVATRKVPLEEMEAIVRLATGEGTLGRTRIGARTEIQMIPEMTPETNQEMSPLLLSHLISQILLAISISLTLESMVFGQTLNTRNALAHASRSCAVSSMFTYLLFSCINEISLTSNRYHLQAAHRMSPLCCRRCFRLFSDDAKLAKHYSARPGCEPADRPPSMNDAIDDCQWARIEALFRRRGQKGVDDISRWYEIWRILFPGVKEPSTTRGYSNQA
jgi:hypothetical protein